jgi:hypothetical protein
VYVLTDPSQPVETTAIALDPTVRACADDAVPDAVVEPPTVIEVETPLAAFAVGVRVIDVTPFTTVAVYEAVTEAKVGVSVPPLIVKLLSAASAFVEAVLVITTVYVVVDDVVSCGVTTTVTVVVVEATVSPIADDAPPDVTGVPFTVTVAPVDVTVGVTVTDATLFTIVEVYDVVPDAKATFSEPSLSTSALSVLTVLSAAALLTVTVYVFVVVVSPAVPTTAIATLPPAVTACADDAAPDATVEPATVMVVPLSVAVGVTVTDAIEFTIDAVYVMVPEANAGLNEPELSDRALSVASLLSAAVRVTVTVYVFTDPSQPTDATEIAFPVPAVRAWAVDTDPDAVVEPPTVIEVETPFAAFAVGVRVTDVTPLTTVAVYVYVLDAKLGVREPELSARLFSLASAFVDAVLVTTTVYVVVADVVS